MIDYNELINETNIEQYKSNHMLPTCVSNKSVIKFILYYSIPIRVTVNAVHRKTEIIWIMFIDMFEISNNWISK